MSVSWQWAKANPDSAARRIRELERENAALREDKARLDWLLTAEGKEWLFYEARDGFQTCREDIDAVRKEAQP